MRPRAPPARHRAAWRDRARSAMWREGGGRERLADRGGEVRAVQRAAVAERGVCGLERLQLVTERLVELGLALRLAAALLDRLEVCERELELDDPEVLDRIAR